MSSGPFLSGMIAVGVRLVSIMIRDGFSKVIGRSHDIARTSAAVSMYS